ncbi:MAG TPA: hypothetical protein VEV42_15905 [Pyrinomonadaceae bacterium]|nr:hypothetical protein [Pyrinomonadaceae bacterium]
MKLTLLLALCTLLAQPLTTGSNDTGFQLTLRVMKAPSRNQSITVEFKIENVSKTQLWLQETSAERDYELEVRDSRGQEVQLTERGRTLRNNKGEIFRNIVVKLNPGERKTDVIDVGSLYDLSKPGDYSLRATRRAVKIGSRTKWAQVESNTVTFKIETPPTDKQ